MPIMFFVRLKIADVAMGLMFARSGLSAIIKMFSDLVNSRLIISRCRWISLDMKIK